MHDLFIEKKVYINNNLYTELYDYIWKSDELFVGFLSHSDPSIKLDYAKKIYSFLQANNDIFLPLSMLDNIIEFQNSNLVDNIKGYIPQDHVVHCVNLYITGIYIFFNNELFNNKLIRGISTENTPKNRYRDFVDRWILFSFYHDIGYYLEGSVNIEGLYSDKYKDKIKYYESEIINEIIYLCTSRIITRLITIASVTKKSKDVFSHKTLEGFNFEGESAYKIDVLKDYDGALLINDLHNFDEPCVLQHIFKYTKSITISYDNNHKPICITLRKFGNIEDFYINKNYKKSFGLDYIKTENCIEMIKDLPCNHYIIDLNKVFHSYGKTLFEKLAVDFFDKLPRNLKEEFSFMSSPKELNTYFNHINEWIISKLNIDYLKKDVNYIHDDLISSCYKNVFSSVLNKSTTDIFNKHKNDKISSEKIIEYIDEIFKKIDTKKLEEDIHTAAYEEYENSHGAFIDIIDFGIIAYNELYEYLYNSNTTGDLIKDLRFIKTNLFNNKVKVDPFSCNKKNSDSIETRFHNKLYEYSTELKINFDDLKKYITSYTICDHGIISAALLYQVIIIFFYIYKGSEDHVKFNLIWNNLEKEKFVDDERIIEKYADVIFAILLHNIYTKNSAPYGIDYRQDIDVNAFSYFCAYCDTIQKWNRAKQVDLSKTYLPEHNYLNDLFDLELKHNKIYIRCFYKDLNQMNQTIMLSEDFLPGITKFTKVLGIDD